jgi:hypothetical protein
MGRSSPRHLELRNPRLGARSAALVAVGKLPKDAKSSRSSNENSILREKVIAELKANPAR